MMTDWKALCEELLEFTERLTNDYYQPAELVTRARAALAAEPVAVQRTDLAPLQAALAHVERLADDFSSACRPLVELAEKLSTGPVAEKAPLVSLSALLRPAYEPGDGSADGAQMVEMAWWHPVMGCDSLQIVVDNARAVLARYGHQPAPPAEGEVGELVAWLREQADFALGCTFDADYFIQDAAARNLTRAADLLEQHHPAPVPVASDTRYEFSVYDEDYTEQVGGSAPTYVQALSEGQRYFAQYQQDGPHTLELRRIEVLPPGAFPEPDDAPLPVLPEDTQVIEPTERTILVPVPVPVAVSEQPYKRPGWCDDEGFCWWFDRGSWIWLSWYEGFSWGSISHCLPHDALPLPQGEVE